MLSDEMSTVKENEARVSRPSQSVRKPGAHLANPVRSFDDLEFWMQGYILTCQSSVT